MVSVQTLKDFHRNNFGLQILEGLSESFKLRRLCDVKIKCGNDIYYAHSIVLASVSQYFKDVFTSSDTCKDLHFKCGNGKDFGSFLHLLYADFDYFTENFDFQDYERLLDIMATLGVDSGYLEYLQLMGTNPSGESTPTSKNTKMKPNANQKSSIALKKSKSGRQKGADNESMMTQGKRKRKKRVWPNMDGLELSQIVANMDEETDGDYEVDSRIESDGIKLEVADFDLSSTDDISTLEKNAVGDPIFVLVGDLPPEELTKIKRRRRGVKAEDSADELAIIPCNICGKMFKKRIHLNQHMLQMHIRPKKYPCKLCSQTFCNTGNLRRHFRVRHLNIRKFLCTLCGKSFTSKSSLDAHNVTTSCKLEIADPMKNYLCKGCGTVVIGLINFRSHKYMCGPFQKLRSLNNTKRSKKGEKNRLLRALQA